MRSNYIRSNIVRLRKEKGFSQVDLAERIGMSVRNFQRIENGDTKLLDASVLIAIAEALEVEISELFERPSIHVDTIHTNNGLVGSGNVTINNVDNDLVKCLNAFGKQQQALFESLSAVLKKIGDRY